MTIVKTVLAGVLIALIIGLMVIYWQFILIGFVGLLFLLWLIGDLRKPPEELSPEEWERPLNALTYLMAQDSAERREAYRDAQAQRWEQQQPPPRDPNTWGGGDGDRFC